MDQKDYIEIGLNGDAPLKVIMRGSVQTSENGSIGVVSLVYATMNRGAAEKRLRILMEESRDYYMVYSVPLDTDLTALEHYPSIAITKEDLM